jgi:DNA-binding response OmpR family regulator
LAAEELGLQGRDVLVVDDDEDFRRIVARSLERHGVTVRVVEHPDAAMQACLERVPELILMDVWMPGRSGLQACRVFRQHPVTSQVPILLMSGQWRDELQLWRALELGATDVLAKERAAVELLARVKAALALSRVARRLEETERRLDEAEGLLALCASCKRVRGPDGGWEPIEAWLRRDVGVESTHGICPSCRKALHEQDARAR